MSFTVSRTAERCIIAKYPIRKNYVRNKPGCGRKHKALEKKIIITAKTIAIKLVPSGYEASRSSAN